MELPAALCSLMKLALTRAEVAAALGVNESQVAEMVEDGALPPPRVWRDEMRWLPAEIEECLKCWPSFGKRKAGAAETEPKGRLLSMNEAASFLGISVGALRDHASAGDIAFVAIGRSENYQRRMFEISGLEGFIDRQRRSSALPTYRQASHSAGCRKREVDARVARDAAFLVVEKLRQNTLGGRCKVQDESPTGGPKSARRK